MKTCQHNHSSINLALNNLNRELEIPLIFLENDIEHKKPDFQYVGRADYVQETSGEHQDTTTSYKWKSKEFSFVSIYKNVWKNGKMPSDTRYNQPEKIDIIWSVVHEYKKLGGFHITLSQNLMTKEMTINVTDSDMDDLILDYLVEKLGRKKN
jgi:hypothetical protein